MVRTSSLLFAIVLAQMCVKAGEPSLLDEGYRHMYNLQFEAAHRSFQAWGESHPAEPMGPVSDAAAYLFSEFDRLHILESEFFLDNDNFRSHQKLTPDPAVRANFEQAINKTQQL